MGSGFAEIYNMNASDLVSTSVGTQFETTWTDISGNVVPVGQFTGIALDGTNIAFLDLVPIKAQSLSVASSTDVTADVVQINQNGITTGALSILDSTSVDGNSNPVARPITVDNGQLMVGGTAVSAAGPTDTMNILDQTAVDTNNDPANQALTVDNGELMLNGNPVGSAAANTPTIGGAQNMVSVSKSDGTRILVSRTEVTFGDWINVVRWADKDENGYNFNLNQSGINKNTCPAPIAQLFTDKSLDPLNNNPPKYDVRAKFADSAVTVHPGFSQGGFDYPVAGISYYDAMKFCNALSQMSGLQPVYYLDTTAGGIYKQGHQNAVTDLTKNGYRMPTEAEMLFLLQGADHTNAHLRGTGLGGTAIKAAPVASYPADSNGLYDIRGNVWELTSLVGSTAQTTHTKIHGGCYDNTIAGANASHSWSNRATLNVLGFRIVRNQ
jgi:formylglycine-generating enzyme required for sulfatase activity